MTLAQINVPETDIAAFCTRNGIRRLAFFGSILTNRFSDSSDIDILVEFQPTERVGFFRLAEMEAELSRILGGRKIDLRTPMDLSRHFRDDVLGRAVPVYEGLAISDAG
jgi:predicted nucleotidyltransferase